MQRSFVMGFYLPEYGQVEEANVWIDHIDWCWSHCNCMYDELDETKNSMIGRCDKQYFLHISVSYLALVHSYFGNEELLA